MPMKRFWWMIRRRLGWIMFEPATWNCRHCGHKHTAHQWLFTPAKRCHNCGSTDVFLTDPATAPPPPPKPEPPRNAPEPAREPTPDVKIPDDVQVDRHGTEIKPAK